MVVFTIIQFNGGADGVRLLHTRTRTHTQTQCENVKSSFANHIYACFCSEGSDSRENGDDKKNEEIT